MNENWLAAAGSHWRDTRLTAPDSLGKRKGNDISEGLTVHTVMNSACSPCSSYLSGRPELIVQRKRCFHTHCEEPIALRTLGPDA